MIEISSDIIESYRSEIEKNGIKFIKDKYKFNKKQLSEFLDYYDLPKRKTTITKSGIIKKPWSNSELDILKQYYNYGGSKLCKKYLTDRADQDIRSKARRIGLYFRDMNRFYQKGKNNRSCVGDDSHIICSICGVKKEKTTTNYIYRKDRNQYMTTCNECRSKRFNKQRSHERNFLQRVWYGAAKRLTNTTSTEVITYEELYDIWLKQDKKCAITGIHMTTATGVGRVQTNVSIDRIDNKLGYTKDNVQLVCLWANTAKNDLPMSEFVEYCKKVLNQG